MLLGKASSPPGSKVAACPGMVVAVAPSIATCEWVWPTAIFSRASRVQRWSMERGRHADYAALEHVPRVEAVRLLNDAAGGKARLGAGESQGIVDRQVIFQLLIAVTGHEIDGEPRPLIQILANEDLGDLQFAGRRRTKTCRFAGPDN